LKDPAFQRRIHLAEYSSNHCGATPLAWYVMKEWLQVFEYRIQLHARIFILSGVVALLIALLTISYRIIKATRVNPVDTLRQDRRGTVFSLVLSQNRSI
jgi:hypothetical protein